MTQEFSRIVVRPVAGRIGADVEGVDLMDPGEHAADIMAEIRAALLRHKVIFFRGQRLNHAGQVALARGFGEITRLPGPKHGPHPEGFPEILVVDPNMNGDRRGLRFEERLYRKSDRHDSGWHVDIGAAVNPPAISVLRCEVSAEHGGDTQWTNLVAAYEGLSKPLQRLADGLRAEHALHAGVQLLFSDEEDVAIIRKRIADNLLSLHPVVRVHPETGEKALFLPPASVSHLTELLPWEGRGLLEILFSHISRPEYTVRHRWEPGDIAVWDNRAVAHLQPADLHYTDYRRRMYRVVVLGDRPTGPDGFRSESLRGAALEPFVHRGSSRGGS
ncbi:TauD/TfdA dioxygenase family protein [Streptomyces sp. NPDC015144]|uniref:TauD/TfdA dioxygenase family protein n=1 Tax=Streptomyces sp. NPDC015144 TaxID=3364944 RepID=UPI0036FE3CD0